MLFRQSRSILLVDDDDFCLQTFSEILITLGYAVRGADNGRTALDIFSKEPFGFSLVILDQVMPELTGMDVAREMLQIRHDIPIALLTGWFLTDEMKQYAKTVGIRKILEKPITTHDLDQAIRQMLI